MPWSPEQEFDPVLLDLHLGALAPGEAEQLRLRMQGDAELRRQNEAVAAVFSALESARSESVPADLASRVLTATAASRLRIVSAEDELRGVAEASAQYTLRVGNLRDILAAAAMIVFMISIGAPAALNMRERNHRIVCSDNLRVLGQGVQQYASTFGANLPFSGWSERMSWRPTGDPSELTTPNRRHVYPLLRQAFVQEPRAFVCPSRGDAPMAVADVTHRSDFPESRNVSYAYFNMAGIRPNANDDALIPILADDNPLFEDGTPLLELRRLAAGDASRTNSSAHRAGGQNILTLDGGVRWMTSPDCGVAGDNIWTLQDVTRYTGHEGPASSKDSHLLK